MIGLIKKFPWFWTQHELIVKNREFFKNFDRTRPLQEYNFVVFDMELTGMKRKKDEIISIGAVKIKNLQIDLGETFHYYVRPQKLDPTEATLVHRITPEQLRKAPPLFEVMQKFVSFVGTDLLVGHYVGLDVGFLNRATEKLLNGTLVNPVIDTMRIAKGYKRVLLGFYHDRGDTSHKYNLKDLSSEFNLPIFEAHDALEDAMQTAYLFLFLIKKFKKGGLVSLRDLHHAGRSGAWRSI
jgi:DNA polymerase-3 subunit epsilon